MQLLPVHLIWLLLKVEIVQQKIFIYYSPSGTLTLFSSRWKNFVTLTGHFSVLLHYLRRIYAIERVEMTITFLNGRKFLMINGHPWTTCIFFYSTEQTFPPNEPNKFNRNWIKMPMGPMICTLQPVLTKSPIYSWRNVSFSRERKRTGNSDWILLSFGDLLLCYEQLVIIYCTHSIITPRIYFYNFFDCR